MSGLKLCMTYNTPKRHLFYNGSLCHYHTEYNLLKLFFGYLFAILFRNSYVLVVSVSPYVSHWAVSNIQPQCDVTVTH